MSLKRDESGDSGLELSGELSLTSNQPSEHNPITKAKPALERPISSIPAESDEEEEEVEVENEHGIKSKLKKIKNKVKPASHDSKDKASDSEYTDKRHDSGNATSDFEITPGTNVSDNIDSKELKAKVPALERHVSSIGEDGLLSTDAGTDDQQQQQHSRGRSPKLERHISGIPQDDYDSDREMGIRD